MNGDAILSEYRLDAEMIRNVAGKTINLPDNQGVYLSTIDAAKLQQLSELCSVRDFCALALLNECFENLQSLLFCIAKTRLALEGDARSFHLLFR
ncbi:MAG: hypothetical protein A2682_02270 [Candidatus Terrybacteria bacterium RIFCSPHIGHO2_01_FULL_58_15]|uniref:Uncharacterized protein n=1 Tax=Terrybacteria sp. (strain RIFCSPHIGHO2_01_FULL_58_15) TaxID=1802363 RepID=A0A1G2PNZ0_TERXR|nr:MAG: hypothetical protein A2682_02270 [Candidatus Terrybacteria bacterium RIFCSPHIGHO2_01_FULL_58_15]